MLRLLVSCRAVVSVERPVDDITDARSERMQQASSGPVTTSATSTSAAYAGTARRSACASTLGRRTDTSYFYFQTVWTF